MKLKNGFITHETDGEQILIDTANNFAGLVRSNPTAAFIVDCLKTDITEAEIIEKMLKKYDVSQETATKDVRGIIAKLEHIGALGE